MGMEIGRHRFQGLADQAGVSLRSVLAAAEENDLGRIVAMITPTPAQMRRRLEERRNNWAGETAQTISPMRPAPVEHARMIKALMRKRHSPG